MVNLFSPPPANQLSVANWNDQSVKSLVSQRSIEHGPQYRFMIDCVVCNKEATRHQAGHQRLITTVIDFLLGVEKAEGDVFRSWQVIQSIPMNQLDNITGTGRLEGLPGKLSLLIQYLVCRNSPAGSSAPQGEP
jgi:hypothetical protein